MLTPGPTNSTAQKILKSLARPFATAATLTALLFCPAKAPADNGTQHFSGSFSVTFFDDCTGENVDIDVTVLSAMHIVNDGAGGLHMSYHDVFSGRGVGETTGTLYNANQSDSGSLNVKIGGEETDTLHFSMISKGGSENFEVSMLFHITVLADGTITAFVNNLSATCH